MFGHDRLVVHNVTAGSAVARLRESCRRFPRSRRWTPSEPFETCCTAAGYEAASDAVVLDHGRPIGLLPLEVLLAGDPTAVGRGRDAARTAVGHRIAGVDREVDQHLLDLAGIGLYGMEIVTETGSQLDSRP